MVSAAFGPPAGASYESALRNIEIVANMTTPKRSKQAFLWRSTREFHSDPRPFCRYPWPKAHPHLPMDVCAPLATPRAFPAKNLPSYSQSPLVVMRPRLHTQLFHFYHFQPNSMFILFLYRIHHHQIKVSSNETKPYPQTKSAEMRMLSYPQEIPGCPCWRLTKVYRKLWRTAGK